MLFRKPVEGDFIRNDESNSVFLANKGWIDYISKHFEMWKNRYTLVTVSEVEPPKGSFVNLYEDVSGGIYIGGPTTSSTRENADTLASPARVACVNLNLLKGRFDE